MNKILHKRKFFRLRDKEPQLMEFREKSIERGLFPGFDDLYDIFSLKPGYPLFIAGSPFSGKTEFALELQISATEQYGWKHFMALGETGKMEEQIAELSHKIVGKPYRKKSKDQPDYFAMTEAEVVYAHMVIDEHFVFVDFEGEESSITSTSLLNFYKMADEAEKEYGIKFNTTLFDPFNDADENLEDYGGREDKYLKDVLRICRIDARKNNRINILVNHIADVKFMIDEKTKRRYYPPAMPNEWAGGRTWHRRAFTMLLVYRPPAFRCNEHGEPYRENETIIYNQKAKPKGSGKIGHCSLFWNWKKNRFYESFNDEIYAHKQGEGKRAFEIATPNFITPPKEKVEEIDEMPF